MHHPLLLHHTLSAPTLLTFRMNQIRREYEVKIQENTQQLLWCFYVWLLLVCYILLDSGTQHIAGIFVLTALGAGGSYILLSLLECCGCSL